MPRTVGAVNKTTKGAKMAIEQVFVKLGGPDAMLAWVKRDETNERIFYGQIYPKLLPLSVSGDPDSPLELAIRWAQEKSKS